MPRKKQHDSATDRVYSQRERRIADGWRRIDVWLPPDAVKVLDRSTVPAVQVIQTALLAHGPVKE